MPRKTKAQIGMLLADLEAAQVDKRKAEKREKDLKEEIGELSLKEGVYGDMSYALGTPREIMDQPAVRELVKANGLKVPTKFTEAPMVVKRVIK